LLAANYEAGYAKVEAVQESGKTKVQIWSPSTEVVGAEAPKKSEPETETELVVEEPAGPSRKETVFKLWLTGNATIEDMVVATADHKRGPVNEKMVKQWLKWWIKGLRFPAFAKGTESEVVAGLTAKVNKPAKKSKKTKKTKKVAVK